MVKILLPALLCLLVSYAAMARQSKQEDSLAKLQSYIIEDSIRIKTADGASLSAMCVRKKGVTEKQAAILSFTIYARQTDIRKATEAADKGYVGVVAYTRGKRYSSGEVLAYEHDGADVNTVIQWITEQSWSNNKVAMYGGSYNGFTQWAATKHLHPALKTIVPSASAAPGLDVPMMNNVFMSFTFPWTYYVSNNTFLDEADYNKREQWEDLYQAWFDQGRPYRYLDTLMGRTGNNMFHHWINHPSYDTYWQNMIPYKEDFAKINIPVLSTTGYYDGGQVGGLYYLREHTKYNPRAEHYLIIGPYGHFGSQGFPDTVYRGYKVDPAALIPIHDIIYQWFDHILKGAPKPAVLKGRINYQVMGTNQWKQAASLDKMSNDSLVLYLNKPAKATALQLSRNKPLKNGYINQQIDFADRQTRSSYYWLNSVIYDTLYTDALMFVSDTLKAPLEISGRFSGRLKAMINKKDMDYSLVLFEQMADGRYFFLSYFMGRASYAYDNTTRKLLVPGRKESIPFSNSYVVSKQLARGSRLVVLLHINKSPFEQINYGTGKEVSDETIEDARQPLQIKWYMDSFIKIPVWKD